MNALRPVYGAVFGCLLLISCSKEAPELHTPLFCNLVQNGNYEATAGMVNSFLSTLPANEPDSNMDALAEWLEQKECIDSAKATCYSCLRSYPPYSWVNFYMTLNGRDTLLLMGVLMEDPPRYAGIGSLPSPP